MRVCSILSLDEHIRTRKKTATAWKKQNHPSFQPIQEQEQTGPDVILPGCPVILDRRDSFLGHIERGDLFLEFLPPERTPVRRDSCRHSYVLHLPVWNASFGVDVERKFAAVPAPDDVDGAGFVVGV